MHMNSNDIFTQIGLVVDHEKKGNSYDEPPPYTAFLQIELSEGKHELLQIRNYDNPHHLAVAFCRKHKLNNLAIQIVKKKIEEAMLKEQERLKQHQRKNRVKSPYNSGKNYLDSGARRQTSRKESPQSRERFRNRNSTNSKQKSPSYFKKSGVIIHKRNHSNSQLHSRSQSMLLNKSKRQIQSKQDQRKLEEKSKSKMNQNKSPPKQNKSPNKDKYIDNQKSKKNLNNEDHSISIHKNKKANPNIGNQLYNKAMIKNKLKQQNRQKILQQQQKLEQQQLTFQPKINPISAKIVQFRRQNPNSIDFIQKQNKNNAINDSKPQKEEQQLKQCTFKPQINKVSNLILQNSQHYRIDSDHFTALYKQAQAKNDKINAKIEKNKEKLFQPKINQRSSWTAIGTFQQRLQKSLIQKKKISEGVMNDSDYSFQPKIGRGPKDSRRINTDNSRIWDQLYTQKLKKNKNPIPESDQQLQPFVASTNSHIYYDNLIEKRISQVFKALDSDEDGYISPECVAIERLTKNQLIFLKPIFEQMDDLQAELDFFQFKKALTIMINEADPSSKGIFLSQKPKNTQKDMFVPQINSKSKQMAYSRIANANTSVHQQLYDMGLKQLQKKQFKLQKERAIQQEKELQDCSFKPLLNNTSKYYIQKVLGKQLTQKFEDQPLYR